MKTEFMLPPSNWRALTYHPLAEIVGVTERTVDDIESSIRDHGYDEQESIIICRDGREDVVLDGRHKLKACIRLNITPSFRRFTGKSIEAYVAKKAFRQHLNASQRAMIAAVLTKQNKKTVVEAAEILNVSERSVADARVVNDKAAPEVREAVANGDISVSDAVKIVDQTPEKQAAAVNGVINGTHRTAREVKEPEQTLDGLKKPVPESLQGIFDERDEFASLMRTVSDLKGHVKRMCERDAGCWLHEEETIRLLEQIRNNLKFAAPHTECPKCRRNLSSKCPMCKGKGWINEQIFSSSATDDDKAWLQDR